MAAGGTGQKHTIEEAAKGPKQRLIPFYQSWGDKELGVGWPEGEKGRYKPQARANKQRFFLCIESERFFWHSLLAAGVAATEEEEEECVFKRQMSLVVWTCNLIYGSWCTWQRAVSERYLYVGQYVCDEEWVAELGNRSGLPNTHRTRTLSSGK